MPNFSEAFVNVALCLPLIHPHRVVLLPSRGLRSHKIDTWTSGPYVFSMPSAFPTFQQYALWSQKMRHFFGRRAGDGCSHRALASDVEMHTGCHSSQM